MMSCKEIRHFKGVDKMKIASVFRTISFLVVAVFVIENNVLAQEVLHFDDALKLALEHNYDIKVASNGIETAANNASVLNSGYLPSANVAANGNLTYAAGDNETVVGKQSFKATEAYNYNASVGISYTLFDGLGRLYNFKQMKEKHNLSKLQAQQVIENTMLQLASVYYQISQFTEVAGILQQSIVISKERKLRAEYKKKYGQATELNVLNAQVDVNNDSINLLNTLQQLDNAKRNLSLIMGRGFDSDFAVDTTVRFALDFPSDELVRKALDRNVLIQQTNSSLQSSEYAIKASRSGWFPAVTANAAYAYSGSENPNGAFLTGNQSYGPQAGLSLTWKLFDGGRTITQQKNAKIALETQKIRQEQTALTVQRDVLNAYATYQNALFVLDAQNDNLVTAKRNFNRSDELYKQGQISSIDFRTAQLNMLNAQSSCSQAKYNAKNAELQVKQLTGMLLNE
ncbi:TolC family protein [Bacteroidota bacterium]